ncbi:MAG: hypothetical protein M1541_18885, partial [Acidobacteria bacterium]|nr:hypothetical protein [Acidobacteriota bacterium]
IEPHGSFADQVLQHVPKSRTNSVVILDPASPKPVGLNPLSLKDKNKAVENCIDIFIGLWDDAFLDRSQYICRNYLRALVEVVADPTLLHLYRMLGSFQYASQILSKANSAVCRLFFEEFVAKSPRDRTEATAAPFNKLDKFFSNEYSRAVFGHPKPLDIGALMNSGHIVIVRMSKGELGSDMTSFLSSVLFHMISAATFERQALPAGRRIHTSIYSDEHHNVNRGHVTETLLAEGRKYNVHLIMADQSCGQIPEAARRTILGNVGALLVSRVSSEDAQALHHELGIGNPATLQTLQMGQWYVKRVQSGNVMQARLTKTDGHLVPDGTEQSSYEVRKQALRRFGMLRQQILDRVDRILTA